MGFPSTTALLSGSGPTPRKASMNSGPAVGVAGVVDGIDPPPPIPHASRSRASATPRATPRRCCCGPARRWGGRDPVVGTGRRHVRSMGRKSGATPRPTCRGGRPGARTVVAGHAGCPVELDPVPLAVVEGEANGGVPVSSTARAMHTVESSPPETAPTRCPEHDQSPGAGVEVDPRVGRLPETERGQVEPGGLQTAPMPGGPGARPSGCPGSRSGPR